MKKVLLFVGCMLAAFANVNAQTAVRNGFTEEFSSSTCPPCVSFNVKYHPAVENVEANTPAAHINVLSYQMNWPGLGNDFSYNSDGLARRSYYAVTGVPTHFVNGVVGLPNTSGLTQAQLETELTGSKSGTSDFEITGKYLVEKATKKMTLDISVNPLKTLSGNYTVHVAISERHYRNDSATVNLYDYYNVMRKMFPSGTGTAVTSWTANTPKAYTYTNNYVVKGPQPIHPAQMSNDLWGDPYMTDMIVFIQDNATKTVVQSQVFYASWPTNIENINKVDNIEIYPNPANDIAHVRFTLDKPATVQVQVTDMMGRVVYQNQDQMGTGVHRFNVPTDNLPAGLYTVVLANGNSRITERLSVVK